MRYHLSVGTQQVDVPFPRQTYPARTSLIWIANVATTQTNPVTLIQLFDSHIKCGLPDTISSKRFYYLAFTKKSREETF